MNSQNQLRKLSIAMFALSVQVNLFSPSGAELSAPDTEIQLLQCTNPDLSLPSDNEQVLDTTEKPFFMVTERLYAPIYSPEYGTFVKIQSSGVYSKGGHFNITFLITSTALAEFQVNKRYYAEDLYDCRIKFNPDEFNDCNFYMTGTNADLDFIESCRRPR